MKSAFKWISVGLCIYLVFIVIKLPASQVLPRLSLNKDISLSGVSGTIWNGRAQRAQLAGLPVENLNWSLSFLSLLMANVSADIQAGNIRDVDKISVDGHITFSNQGLQAKDLLAFFPTNLIISLLPLPIPVQADGRFKVQLEMLDYGSNCITLTGKGEWLNANFTGANQVISLGNFAAELSCVNGDVVLDVLEPNSFGLTAKATIPADMKFKISGKFKPDAELPKEVHQAAQFFGKPDADGYYPIEFK
jgi:general secretion pathway protein N